MKEIMTTLDGLKSSDNFYGKILINRQILMQYLGTETEVLMHGWISAFHILYPGTLKPDKKIYLNVSLNVKTLHIGQG